MPADPDMDDGSKPTGGDSGTGAKLTERDRLLDRGRSPSREGTSSSAPNGDEGAAEDSTLLISKNGASAEPKTKKLGGKAGAKGTSGAKKSATAGAKADAGAKPTKGKAKGKSPIRKDNGTKGAPKGKTGGDATGDNGGGTAEPKDGEKRITGGRGRGTNKEDKKSSAGQKQQSQQSLQALEEASKGGADLGYLNYVLDVLPFVKTNMPLGFGYYMSMKPSATAEPALFDSSAATNHGLRIRVRQLTGMGTELHLVRPYVVVHVLNRYTGRYIRPDGMQAVVAPVRTLECSMREGSPVPIWNKELTPNGPLNDLVNPHTIIMYELLDSRVPIKSKRIGLAGRTIKRVAWAFQVPCGADNRRLTVGVPDEWRATSTAHKAPVEDEEEAALAAREAAKASRDMAVPLQLYAYQKGDMLGLDALQRKYMGWHSYGGSSFFESVKSSASANPLSLVSDDSSYPDGVPEVYVQWRKQSVEAIKGTLMVAAGAVERVSETFRESAAMAAKLDESVIEDNQEGAVLGGAESAHSDVGLKYKLAAAARTRSNPREPCTIPTRLLHRLDVGPDGATAVAFSNSGAWLAVGAVVSGASTGLSAPYPGSVYALKIYDPDTGFERWFNDAAHHGPIYSIQWSKDDQYILTTSGDSTVRVWRLALTRVPITGQESAQKRKSTHRRSSGKGDGADSAAMVPTTEALSVTPVANMRHMPLVHVYCAVFQETTLPTAAPTSMSSADGSPSQDKDGASAKSEKHFIPTVVTGASDGHLRVWSGSAYQGSLLIRGGGQGKSLEDSICEEAPHFFAVQDVTIDTRTRYLLSGDAGGNIMLWRLDAYGWYNLLRKFKKDDLPGTCITTMCMHPEKTKGQLLVMAKPATLRVYSLSTYRMVNSYPGAINELPGLTRACFSADGAFVAAGSELPSQGGGGGSSGGSPGGYRLRLWNTQGGGQESSDLTEMTMPFPIRAVAWHPTQHMVVVGMQGAGASVAILVAKKESAAIQARKRNSLALKSLFNAADDDGDGTDSSTMGGPTGATSTTPFGDTFGSATSSNSPASERAAKARSMIEKIRATRAKARQEGQLRRAAERDETSEDGMTAEGSGVAGDRLVSNSLTALPSSRGMSATMATVGRLSDNLSRAPATPASATMR